MSLLHATRSLASGLRWSRGGARCVSPAWCLPYRCTYAHLHVTAHQTTQSTRTDAATGEQPHGQGEHKHGSTNMEAEVEELKRSTAMHASRAHDTMERAAAARQEIYEIWRHVADAEAIHSPASHTSTSTRVRSDDDGERVSHAASPDAERLARLAALLANYRIDPSTPREEDVCRGLGDALDRLILLCVPLPIAGSTDMLETVLHVAARQGRQLSVRTVQHLFARTSGYAEALAVFYALRRCNFAMNMEAYHAMLYSLQRLEEEGWAQRFHEEYTAQKVPRVSEQALDFILRGVDNQLLPENKPWLGRIMFADSDNAAAARRSLQDFDEHGKLWVKRYRGGGDMDV